LDVHAIETSTRVGVQWDACMAGCSGDHQKATFAVLVVHEGFVRGARDVHFLVRLHAVLRE
jgi:hypothetical protein